MAFMLYAAGRMLDGAKLYRDVMDVNPPMIFALNLPVAWLARAAGLSDILLARLSTALFLGCLLLFVRRLLGRYLLANRAQARRYVLLVLCFILFPLSREDFGQREHLVLAFLLPGLVVAIARSQREQVELRDAGASGVLSGLALALKPQFALAWLAVEGWRRIRDRPSRWQMTPELVGALGTVTAYGLAVIALTPDYIRLAERLGPAYTTYLRIPLLNLLLFSPGAALTAFALLAAAASRKEPDRSPREAVALATIGCFLAGVAQQKGLRYQFYPSFALAALLVGLVAAQTGLPRGPGGRLYLRLSRWLVVAICAVVLGRSALDATGGSPADRRRRAEFLDLVETVRAHAGPQSVGMLSYYMGSAFPLITYAGVGLASRFPCLWILPASYWPELWRAPQIRYRAPAEMDLPERLLNAAVAEDLIRARPRLLLVLRAFPDDRRYGLRRLNYIAYFSRQAELARLFAGYQLIATKGQYDVYERVGPGVAPTGPAPSPVVAPLDARPPSASERATSPPVDPEFMAGSAVFLLVGLTTLLREQRGRRTSGPP